LSTFAVENRGAFRHRAVAAAERLPRVRKGKKMRIAEMAAAGFVALAAQILIAATVLL
jgi:hypothetical protein